MGRPPRGRSRPRPVVASPRPGPPSWRECQAWLSVRRNAPIAPSSPGGRYRVNRPAKIARVSELVPTSQAAKAVGVSARSLARWAQEGTLQPDLVTPGGHLRWNVERLREQLRRRE